MIADAHAKGVNSTHGPADAATQRLNMVESQVRPSDVTDRRIIRAMGQIPREAFAPDAYKSVAYMDEAIPLSTGPQLREMPAPRVLAKLIQAGQIDDSDVVLDLGCATGYSTAIIARLARKVVGVEANADWSAAAKLRLSELGAANATVVTGALPAGAPGDGPYDVIVMNGAVTSTPHALFDQLKEGGRLVAIEMRGRAGKAKVWTRAGGHFDGRENFEASAPVLPGFETPLAFKF